MPVSSTQIVLGSEQPDSISEEPKATKTKPKTDQAIESVEIIEEQP